MLEGRKTQTRRILKPQPDWIESSGRWRWPIPKRAQHPGCSTDCVTASREWYEYMPDDCCPYGKLGDLLWVRETWEEVHPCQIDDGRFSLPGRAGIPGPPPVNYLVIYRADGEYPRLHFREEFPFRERCLPGCQRDHTHPQESWHGWVSPIHMPRWASRLTLKITDVRAQRVQEISEDDACEEGARVIDGHWTHTDKFQHFHSPTESFHWLWNRINGADAWKRNDWVWPITFEVIAQNVDDYIASRAMEGPTKASADTRAPG